MRSAAGTRGFTVSGHPDRVPPRYLYCAPAADAMTGLIPYSSAALRQQACRAVRRCKLLGTEQLVELPVRVAGAVHHHVVLAGEAEPLTGEVDVAGTVHRALHEVDMAGQIVAGHLRRPWVCSRCGRPKQSIRHMNGVSRSAAPSAQTNFSSGNRSKTPSAIMFIRWYR